MTVLCTVIAVSVGASALVISHASAQATVMSVRRALDPEAREALRFGVSSGRVPYISVVVPAQIESDDVTYWSWVLALDASTAERLLEGVRLGQAADDQVRERVLLPLFRLAEQVSTPSEQFTVTEAPGLTRALVASRARALAELRSTERAMIERCLTDTQLMPVETETGSQLDALRQQGLTTAQFESLVATRVDVGRFLYRVSKGALRVALSRDSMEIARQCLVDAQPTLTEQRRAHDAAFAKCLDTGGRVLILSTLRQREVALDPETVQEWRQRNERARRPLAAAARRIAEANLALIDLICAAIPDDQGKRLHRAFLDQAYGPLAITPWDIEPLATIMATEVRESDRPTIALLLSESGASAATARQALQRVADQYWQSALATSRPNREKWTNAAKRMMSLHSSERARVEQLLSVLIAGLPTDRQDAWEPQVTTFRNQSAVRATDQLEALDAYFTKLLPTLGGNENANSDTTPNREREVEAEAESAMDSDSETDVEIDQSTESL